MQQVRRRFLGTRDTPFLPGTLGFLSPVAQRAACFLYVWAVLRNSWAWHFGMSLGVHVSCRSEFQHPGPAPGHTLCPTHVPPSIVWWWSQPARTPLSAVAKVDNEQREGWEDSRSLPGKQWVMASTTQIITGCLKYQLKWKQVGQASESAWANYTLLRACWAHCTPSLSKHWPSVWWEKPSVPGCSLKGIRDIQPISPHKLSGTTKWGHSRTF